MAQKVTTMKNEKLKVIFDSLPSIREVVAWKYLHVSIFAVAEK